MTLDVNICHGGLGLGRDYRSIFKIKFMVVISSGSESRILKKFRNKLSNWEVYRVVGATFSEGFLVNSSTAQR